MFDLRDVLIKIRTTLDKASLKQTERDLAQSMQTGLKQIDTKNDGLTNLSREASRTSQTVRRSFSETFKSMVNEGRKAMSTLAAEMKKFAKDEGGWLDPKAFRMNAKKLTGVGELSVSSVEMARQKALAQQIRARLEKEYKTQLVKNANNKLVVPPLAKIAAPAPLARQSGVEEALKYGSYTALRRMEAQSDAAQEANIKAIEARARNANIQAKIQRMLDDRLAQQAAQNKVDNDARLERHRLNRGVKTRGAYTPLPVAQVTKHADIERLKSRSVARYEAETFGTGPEAAYVRAPQLRPLARLREREMAMADPHFYTASGQRRDEVHTPLRGVKKDRGGRTSTIENTWFPRYPGDHTPLRESSLKKLMEIHEEKIKAERLIKSGISDLDGRAYGAVADQNMDRLEKAFAKRGLSSETSPDDELWRVAEHIKRRNKRKIRGVNQNYGSYRDLEMGRDKEGAEGLKGEIIRRLAEEGGQRPLRKLREYEMEFKDGSYLPPLNEKSSIEKAIEKVKQQRKEAIDSLIESTKTPTVVPPKPPTKPVASGNGDDDDEERILRQKQRIRERYYTQQSDEESKRQRGIKKVRGEYKPDGIKVGRKLDRPLSKLEMEAMSDRRAMDELDRLGEPSKPLAHITGVEKALKAGAFNKFKENQDRKKLTSIWSEMTSSQKAPILREQIKSSKETIAKLEAIQSRTKRQESKLADERMFLTTKENALRELYKQPTVSDRDSLHRSNIETGLLKNGKVNQRFVDAKKEKLLKSKQERESRTFEQRQDARPLSRLSFIEGMLRNGSYEQYKGRGKPIPPLTKAQEDKLQELHGTHPDFRGQFGSQWFPGKDAIDEGQSLLDEEAAKLRKERNEKFRKDMHKYNRGRKTRGNRDYMESNDYEFTKKPNEIDDTSREALRGIHEDKLRGMREDRSRPLRELASVEKRLKSGDYFGIKDFLKNFFKDEGGYLDIQGLKAGFSNMWKRITDGAAKIGDRVTREPANVKKFGDLVNGTIDKVKGAVGGVKTKLTTPQPINRSTEQPAGVQAFGNLIDKIEKAPGSGFRSWFNLYDKWFANRPRTDSAVTRFSDLIRGVSKGTSTKPSSSEYVKPTMVEMTAPAGVAQAIRLTKEKEAQLRLAKKIEAEAKQELKDSEDILRAAKKINQEQEARAKKYPTQTNKTKAAGSAAMLAGAQSTVAQNTANVAQAMANVNGATAALATARASVAKAVTSIVSSTATTGPRLKAALASGLTAFSAWSSSMLTRAAAFGKRFALGLALAGVSGARALTSGILKAWSPISGFFAGVGRQARLLASYLGVYLGVRAVYSFVKNSVGMFAEFDLAMARSMAIMTDVDQAMRQKLEERAKSIAKTWNVEFVDAANSIRYLAQAGFSAAQAFEALPIVTKFSKASLVDVAKASDLLTTSQAALGLRVKDAVINMELMKRVSDVLTRASIDVEGSMEQIAEALNNKAGPAARVYKRDIEEVVAVLEAFHRQGIKGQTAGERFAIFLREVSNAAVKHEKVWKHYGLEVFDAQHNLKPLADVIEMLTKKFDGLNDTGKVQLTMQLGLTQRSIDATRALMGMSDVIREWERNNRSATGFTERVALKNMDAFSERWGRIQKTVQAARMEMAKELIPVLEEVMGIVQTNDDQNGPKKISGGILDIAKAIRENKTTIVDFIHAIITMIGWFVAIGKAILDINDSFNTFEASLRSMMSGLVAGFAWLNNKVDETLSWLAKLVTFGKSNFVSRWFDGFAEKSKKAFVDSVKDMKEWWDIANGFRQKIENRGQSDTDLKPNNKPPTLPPVVVSTPELKGLPPVRIVASQKNVRDPNEDDADKLVDDKTQRRIDTATERMQSAMEDLRSANARTTEDVEDNLIAVYEKLKDKILDAVKAAKAMEKETGVKIFTPEMQKEIDATLPKIEQFSRDMQGVQDAKQLRSKIDLKDNKNILDPSARAQVDKQEIDAMFTFIEYLEAQRDAVDENNKAWKEYDDMINKAYDDLETYATGRKNDSDEAKDERELFETRVNNITSIMSAAANQISSVWADAWDQITNGARVMNTVVNAIGRSISSSLIAAGAEWAAQKANMEWLEAGEETAKGIGALASGNPGAFGHFKSATAHAAIAAGWSALAGVGGSMAASAARGGGGTGGRGGGKTSTAGDKNKADTRGPEINIYLDGFDPKNPRHTRLLRDGIREVREKYGTGSVVSVNSR